MISRQSLRSGVFFKRCAVVCGVLALGCVVVSIFVPISLQHTADRNIQSHTLINSNATAAYKRWLNPSQPTLFDVWVFNITNPGEILQGKLPSVQEIGPFTYQVIVEKLDVHWSQDHSTIKYKDYVRYVPVGNTEAASMQNITTVNFPFMGLAGQHLDGIFLWDNCTDPLSIHKGSAPNSRNCLFSTKPIRDIIWGYNDSFLQLFGLRVPGFRQNFTSPAAAAAYLGHTRIYTGSGISELNREVVAWDGMASLNCCNMGSCGPNDRGGDRRSSWGGEEANQFSGMMGDQWPQAITATAPYIHAFFPEVYRSLRLDRVGALEVSSVPVNRYHLSPTPFMNATVNADNGDYYGYGPSGLINITNCAYKTDMFVSKPHFLDGDGALITNVTGLTPPNITAHDTYYDIEPLTGMTVSHHKRLQFNAWVRKIPTYLLPDQYFFADVASVFVPVLWFDEHSEITGTDADSFLDDINRPLAQKTVVLWAGVCGAIVFAVCTGVAWVVGSRRRKAYTSLMGDFAAYVSLSHNTTSPHSKGKQASIAQEMQSLVHSDILSQPINSYGATM